MTLEIIGYLLGTILIISIVWSFCGAYIVFSDDSHHRFHKLAKRFGMWMPAIALLIVLITYIVGILAMIAAMITLFGGDSGKPN